MLELIVFRHAKAAREPGQPDHQRALTGRGRRNAKQMGEWLAAARLAPDMAIVSDAARTQETFSLARKAFPDRLKVISDPELYHTDEHGLLHAVQQCPDEARRVLLCGHNPGLHDFVTALAGAGERDALDRLREGFPTASVAVVELDGPWRDVRWRAGRLVRFETPASLGGEEA